jgi:hypothetical protein
MRLTDHSLKKNAPIAMNDIAIMGIQIERGRLKRPCQ